jgi:hypothetical protein
MGEAGSPGPGPGDLRGTQPPLVERSDVSPEYFRLLDIPLRQGRLFSERDSETAPPVAVINEALARTYWPNGDALGKRFKLRPALPWSTVVGVIADARTESLADGGIPKILEVLSRTKRAAATGYSLLFSSGNVSGTYMTWLDGMGYRYAGVRGLMGVEVIGNCVGGLILFIIARYFAKRWKSA